MMTTAAAELHHVQGAAKPKPDNKKGGASSSASAHRPRPLSAYNVFFRHERARILLLPQSGQSSVSADFGPPSDLTLEGVRDLLAKNPYQTPGAGKKRRHRKTHGMVSFLELNRIVSLNWKALDEKSKSPFYQVAQELKVKMIQEEQQAKAARIENDSQKENEAQSKCDEATATASPPAWVLAAVNVSPGPAPEASLPVVRQNLKVKLLQEEVTKARIEYKAKLLKAKVIEEQETKGRIENDSQKKKNEAQKSATVSPPARVPVAAVAPIVNESPGPSAPEASAQSSAVVRCPTVRCVLDGSLPDLGEALKEEQPARKKCKVGGDDGCKVGGDDGLPSETYRTAVGSSSQPPPPSSSDHILDAILGESFDASALDAILPSWHTIRQWDRSLDAPDVVIPSVSDLPGGNGSSSASGPVALDDNF